MFIDKSNELCRVFAVSAEAELGAIFAYDPTTSSGDESTNNFSNLPNNEFNQYFVDQFIEAGWRMRL
jgi:hypothetical protein